jgi:hypothetical protein
VRKVIASGKYSTVVCLGDFADFNDVSAHPKSAAVRLGFNDELKAVSTALDELDAACKAGGVKRKLFLEGNHETRLERLILKMAPQLLGIVDWRHLLQMDQRRWQVTAYKESIWLGKLRLSHDFGRAGVNAAREACRDVGESVGFGHTHRLQVHYQGTVAGPRHVGATLGWGGDPEAIDYRHKDAVRRDSIHGFGTVDLLRDGQFWLNAIPVINGKAIVDGVFY